MHVYSFSSVWYSRVVAQNQSSVCQWITCHMVLWPDERRITLVLHFGYKLPLELNPSLLLTFPEKVQIFRGRSTAIYMQSPALFTRLSKKRQDRKFFTGPARRRGLRLVEDPCVLS